MKAEADGLLKPNSGDVIFEGTVGSTGNHYNTPKAYDIVNKQEYRHIFSDNM